jgi:Kef-type K+ transport system membrane component KefB
MTETWFLATLWLGLALIATLVSIWLRVATALSEIVVGTVAQLVIGAMVSSTVLGVHEPWIKFLAGTVGKDHVLIRRLRTVTFGLLTPFYFIRAGSFVSVPALIAGPAIFLALLLAKMAAKMVAVYPVTKFYKSSGKDGMYTTLLMSTGLTFGSISPNRSCISPISGRRIPSSWGTAARASFKNGSSGRWPNGF